MKIFTINALREAINSKQAILNLKFSLSRKDKRVEDLKLLCNKMKIKFSLVTQDLIDKESEKNQGLCGEILDFQYSELEELNDNHNFVIVLDGITDTGNFGAIIRTAAAANADAIIVAHDNAAPINDQVLRSSAGTLGKTPIIKVTNLSSTIEKLKEVGFWFVTADSTGDKDYTQVDYKYKTAIIMGSEDRGVSRLLKDKSDFKVKIPHSPDVESLNVSAATAVLVFEVLRQRKSFFK